MNINDLQKTRITQNDLQKLVALLKQNPFMGDLLVSDNAGNNAYKIRLAISSKNKGKSGGARVITYFVNKENELYLLSIYDKSEQSNITDRLLKSLIQSAVKS